MKRNIYIPLAFFVMSSHSLVMEGQNPQNTSRPVMSYQTTIYTDKTLADELVVSANINETRNFASDLAASLGNAAIGVATGYISSLVDFGIQALGQLITMDRRHKQEWMEITQKESLFTDTICTLYAIEDFYSVGSKLGMLDPTGIQFNGIGCLATVGQDTSFYVSCHLNRTKLRRMLDHSKFEMLLDTLIINPYCSHLPNSSLPLRFSFAERKRFDFVLKMQITSSWMDIIPNVHNNEKLGEFVLKIPIDSADIKENGKLIYKRKKDEEPKYALEGECFIVPRSYMQFPDSAGNIQEYYGTGQYRVNVMIEERCAISPEYQKNWRKDRKMRQELLKKGKKRKTFDDVCKPVTHQTWDEALQSWVVTILKAPADYSIKTLNELIKIPTQQQSQPQPNTPQNK